MKYKLVISILCLKAKSCNDVSVLFLFGNFNFVHINFCVLGTCLLTTVCMYLSQDSTKGSYLHLLLLCFHTLLPVILASPGTANLHGKDMHLICAHAQ